MNSLPAAFTSIAMAFNGAFGAPFWDARIVTQGAVEYDDGGSIVPGSGSPEYRECKAQVDVATVAMRGADGFVEGDRSIIVLGSTLEGNIGTNDKIDILEGPFAGLWLVESSQRDPASIGFELRGRQA